MPTPAFSLGGPAGGDFAYALKPGGVDYYRGSTPITREQYNSANTVAGNIGPHSSQLESQAGTVLGDATAPTNPNNTKPAAAPPDKTNDIALQNAGLGAVGTQESSGLAAIGKALSGLLGQYGQESTANEGNYNQQSTTNQGNLQSNKQSALSHAAEGRRGLFGTLASLGALNGSGVDLANRAVQTGANEDLSGAANNYSSNQVNLDNAINEFRQADKERRQNAQTAAEDAQTNVKNEAAKSRQTYFSNLANDYGTMNDKGNAAKYTQLAAAEYPNEAATSIPSTNLGYTGAAFTPGTLANYLAGASGTQVSTAPPAGSKLPGLFAGLTPDRRKAAAAV